MHTTIFALFVLAASAVAQPTLVELFTSEGCNSCPPADAYMRELAATKQDAGNENILIAWHVDYWDRLGWKDPYGLAMASQRQRDYAAAMERRGGAGRPGVYTPQMIVGGRRAFVGSDKRAGAVALGPRQRGAAEPLQIAMETRGNGVTLTTTLPRLPEGTTVMGVLVEDELTSVITAGENQGRTLTHDRVARSAATGEVANGVATIDLVVPEGVVRENASVVVFAQAHEFGAILAVGTAPVPAVSGEPERYHTLAFGDKGETIRYALILPDGYDPEKAYPAMLALPPGAQNEAMVEAGLGRYWENTARERGWIVVSPINPEGARYFQSRSDPLGALMDDINARFNVEGDQFHVTGVSNGGRAAFLAAMDYPELFASITVLPGVLAERTSAQRVNALRGVPITMYVGSEDTDWVRAARRAVGELEIQGIDATLEVLEGEGHVVDLAPATLFDLLESRRPQ